MNGVDNGVGNKKTRKDEKAESSAVSHQQQPDHTEIGDQRVSNEATPAFNSTTSAPRRPGPSMIGLPLNRDGWLIKEYFSYLCGTFDIRSLIDDHLNGLQSVSFSGSNEELNSEVFYREDHASCLVIIGGGF